MSKRAYHLGVDIMGSDAPPSALFEAVRQMVAHPLAKSKGKFLVFGTEPVLRKLKNDTPQSISFFPVEEEVTMQDSPLFAARRKKKSSMAHGMRLLKEKKIDGFVSAGNTGALIANAALYLPLLPGIERPALLAVLPTAKKPMAVIDVGANVSCKASHLVQFAHMGAAYQKSQGITHPRVGLLNIGEEAQKGRPEVHQAYQELKKHHSSKFHFIGNIEGRDVFHGDVDVLITDGFTGNVFLKTVEGTSSFVLECVRKAFKGKADKILTQLDDQFSDEKFSGAVLCGIDGVVVKCHGYSTTEAMYHGIIKASQLIFSSS